MGNLELVAKIRDNEIDIVEHTHRIIEEAKKLKEDYNYFNVISENLAIEQAKELKKQILEKKAGNKKLLGLAISVKDSICVKGVESTAGSRILKGYRPLFDAHVIEKIKEQGGIIIGKSSQDEFGFGAFSVNTYNIPKNPFDKLRTCGGSSGGAAGLSQKFSNHIAIGESTGGSIVEPASFCGVYGLCPTYGRVSRYGLMDFGNSLDKIGAIGKTIGDAALLMNVIAGHDERDSTSLKTREEDFESYIKKPAKGMKVGIIKEAFSDDVDENVQKKVHEGLRKLEENGVKAEEISLELPIKYGIATYYVIGTSEASTNLAKYCGIRYGASDELEGNFNEYFTKIRSSNFTEEAKRRIIIGTFTRMAGYRDAFYIKAMKVRTLMINEYKKAFRKFDVLVSPTAPYLPPKFSEIEKLSPMQHYLADVMTVSPNVAGFPHLNVPVGFSHHLPVGMLLTADHLHEGKLIQLANAMG